MLHKISIKEKWIIWLCSIGLLFLLCGADRIKENYLQKGIANEVIRFHVLADSDREEAQQIKLKVKDRVVTYMQEKLVNVRDKNQARNIIQGNLGKIEKIAKDTLQREGVKLGVKAYLTKKEFPVKAYGEFVFPEGVYETLQVEIGKAEGRNWWCVMFPSLCMIDESYTVVPDDAKEKLQESLTKEEYESLQEEETVEYKWKIAEWWKGIDYFF